MGYRMFHNFKELPYIVMLLVALGLFVPFLIFVSAIQLFPDQWGKIIAFTVVVSSATFYAAILFLRRKKAARIMYVVGWVIVHISPVFHEAGRQQLSGAGPENFYYIPQLVMTVVTSVALLTYLFLSKKLKTYFAAP